VPAYKIGSGEADNLPLIRHIARKGKPVILSTGMQTIETIRASVAILDAAGHRLRASGMHEPLPLAARDRVAPGGDGTAARLPEGGRGVFRPFDRAGDGAGLGGARRLDPRAALHRHALPQGPDISCSMDPAELRFLIDRSREIWTALHNPKERTAPEEDVYRFARGSVVADRLTCPRACDRRGRHLGAAARLGRDRGLRLRQGGGQAAGAGR
jgi:hypothetical protein